jgi:hypothetical protein
MKQHIGRYLSQRALLTPIMWALVFGCVTLKAAQAANWTKTPASGMGDVAVGPDGKVWLAGKNGTIWFTNNGKDFTQVEASGFDSVAVGPDGTVWAIGLNGTLWRYR